ncbi:unnamed protein product [Didymodactylos carnosus]|uniref:Acetylserotonin O-methyltransferase n=1 Tax=Didymodactylos carnosus TaxID=1234261 RepID=A0A815TH31_9BILA|nr:unnamed protein product [Didymodactylos carnosus]CAF1506367.1 unnamed protein product [Didymodactylos carnosus]CAF3873754.1 unnamed protein product [Didymodactylos carnosus]CAF4367475.1 unnamed protein product [Didymodactylos carnosus]
MPSTGMISSPGSIAGLPKFLSLIAHDWLRRSFYVFAKLGVADLFDGAKPHTVSELIANNTDQTINFHGERLQRILFHVEQGGLVHSDSKKSTEPIFTLTEDGQLMRATHPLKMQGIVLWDLGSVQWDLGGVSSGIESHLAAMVAQQGPYANDQTATPVSLKLKSDNWFEAFASRPELKQTSDLFNVAMSAYSNIEWQAIRSSNDIQKRISKYSVLCDIGGSLATFSVNCLHLHPQLHAVSFDLPEVSRQARVEQKDLPENILCRLRIIGGGFFDLDSLKQISPNALLESINSPTKSVVYHMKNILHDWSDEKTLEILYNLKTTFLGDSLPDQQITLLLTENHILPSDHPAAEQFNWINRGLDIHMLLMTGGKQRTVVQWQHLLEQTGWEYQQIVTTESPISVVIAKLVKP